MTSAVEKPSVCPANTDEKKTTVLIPSSKNRYARRKPRRSGSVRSWRRVAHVWVKPVRTARASVSVPGRSGGRLSMAGSASSPKIAAVVRNAPPYRPLEREGQGGGEGQRRARVPGGEPVRGEPPAPRLVGEVGQVGVVVDDGGLEADRRHDGQDEAPHGLPGVDGRHESRRADRHVGERRQEPLPEAGVVGDGSEGRGGDRDDRHRERHGAAPPEVTLAALVAHDRERVVLRVHRGGNHRHVRGVREVVEEPGDDRPAWRRRHGW